MTPHSSHLSIWQRCEIAWAEWLANQGYAVVLQMDLLNNTPLTKAPVTILPRGKGVAIAPDIRASRDGVSVLWEVKSRRRADIHPETGHAQHWMPLRNYQDYRKTQHEEGFVVNIALYEHGDAVNDGQWYTVPLDLIHRHGRRGTKTFADGTSQTVVYWPVDIMVPCDGPIIAHATQPMLAIQHEPVDAQDPELVNDTPIDPELTDDGPHTVATLVDVERQTRHTPSTPMPAGSQLQFAVLASNPWHGLEVLAKHLGLTHAPRYSVLHVAPAPITKAELDVLFGLCHYGMRVFLYSANNPFEAGNMPNIYRAFLEARFIEWSINPDLAGDTAYWEVDGVAQGAFNNALTSTAGQYAGPPGFEGINIQQYRVVHAPASDDILVSAGAGTGKTETMAERLMYLLSVPRGGLPLQMKEISLITFTREAAREMRSRISRTIMLRQRLASRYVHPAVVWLMQLGQAQIVTIHAFAKRIIQQNGAVIGINPLFKVGQLQREWRRIAIESLDRHLVDLFETQPHITPPIHTWLQHIRQLWQSLENNGVELIDIGNATVTALSDIVDIVDDSVGSDQELIKAVHNTIQQIRTEFQQHCFDEQTIPTSQLIATAVRIITQLNDTRRTLEQPLRYLFVDEFQDTDEQQINLVLLLRKFSQTAIFAVGDVKQGIYRFRGATGNAFDVLLLKACQHGLEEFATYSLVRNFRSDGALLDSMHKYFAYWGDPLLWGETPLLVYGDTDRLYPRLSKSGQGKPVQHIVLKRTHAQDTDQNSTIMQQIVSTVSAWHNADTTRTIAILTRTNQSAISVQQAIRNAGGQCSLRVGGAFYQTPAVRELRVFLDAIIHPHDDAAILELCETRWAVKLFSSNSAPDLVDNPELWQRPLPPFYDWFSRFVNVTDKGNFYRSDIEPLRKRIISLASSLQRMSAIAFIVNCRTFFAPERCALPDDTDDERQRYERCLIHALTLIDATFADASAPLNTILEWVRNQMLTNHDEDEPVDEVTDGETVALTVHKSKGLEFDCVLIPFTNSVFAAARDSDTTGHATQVVIDPKNTEKQSIGWRWHVEHMPMISNRNSQDPIWGKDLDESRREETRLLYVAMTRAKHQLAYFRTRDPREDTWGKLLQLGESNDA
jgi:superfamily I DNA/RNA helicase